MSGQGGVHRFQHEAMATVFEIRIAREDYRYAQGAAQAAFEELDRLERELNRYAADSDIARINRLAPGDTLPVGLDTLACLRRCRKLYDETEGAFDVTIGLVLDGWRSARRQGRDPTEKELAPLRRRTGMNLLALDESHHAVTVRRGPIRVDLGGFGKGYALEQMASILKDWEIASARLHGGRSTVLAMSAPPGEPGWPVTISRPLSKRVIRRFTLRHQALSGSGLKKDPHIIDPRTARPVIQRQAAWCLARSAATADALSTAFMVMREEAIGRLVARHPGMLAVIVRKASGGGEGDIVSFGDAAATDESDESKTRKLRGPPWKTRQQQTTPKIR